MNESNQMSWKEMKDFCNSLNEEQLKEPVILWREEEAINCMEPITLTEDHYIGGNDEGCYSLSDAGLKIEDVDRLELKKVYKVGDPILCEIF